MTKKCEKSEYHNNKIIKIFVLNLLINQTVSVMLVSLINIDSQLTLKCSVDTNSTSGFFCTLMFSGLKHFKTLRRTILHIVGLSPELLREIHRSMR